MSWVGGRGKEGLLILSAGANDVAFVIRKVGLVGVSCNRDSWVISGVFLSGIDSRLYFPG